MNEIAIRRTPTDGSHFPCGPLSFNTPFGEERTSCYVVYSMCRDAAMAAPLSNASAVLFPVPVILKAIAFAGGPASLADQLLNDRLDLGRPLILTPCSHSGPGPETFDHATDTAVFGRDEHCSSRW